MAGAQNEGLFLLEVLIDKIVFVKSPCFPDQDFRTCVNVQASAVEPLEICDDEPDALFAKSSSPFVKNFNSGKSCLFSLKEDQIKQAMSKFPIHLSVYKALPCGCLPTKITIGEATIDMTKEFVEARQKFLQDPTSVSYQALKDSFKITGAEGEDAGEIVMFLRITCFGKLIITRFQGSGAGAPMIGAGGAPSYVDRSCNPPRQFQTRQEPCACGAARGHGGGGGGGGAHAATCPAAGGGGGQGVCPTAIDPYNSMPCQEPDDPCYCCGPKPAAKQQMACRNTADYCLHVPKGQWQDMNAYEMIDLKLTALELKRQDFNNTINESRAFMSKLFLERMKPRSASMIIRQQTNSSTGILSTPKKFPLINFGPRETAVFNLSVYQAGPSLRHSGTQATASVNKCLQVFGEKQHDRPQHDRVRVVAPKSYGTSSDLCSTCTMSTLPSGTRGSDYVRFSDVYFFGKKNKDCPKRSNVSLQSHKSSSTTGAQTKHPTGASTATSTAKAVSIKDEKHQSNDRSQKNEKPCPSLGSAKEDMMMTVSHIRIGPRETCPIHGKEPCKGPKCVTAKTAEDTAPVKVTTMSNPRRGVFELVVRRLTGAPLAKNELMLEWTPPPSRPPTCGAPCGPPCGQPCPPFPCRPSSCKMVLCRMPKRCCKPKSCKKPCGPRCKKCCGKPCSPPPCTTPCPKPCCRVPCGAPCSTPCFKPCKVGRACKRPRRCRSQPKIRAHPARKSPCRNRSTTCPVVRCRSTPCSTCCSLPCPPSKCVPSPCKPPQCCKSCSTCCM